MVWSLIGKCGEREYSEDLNMGGCFSNLQITTILPPELLLPTTMVITISVDLLLVLCVLASTAWTTSTTSPRIVLSLSILSALTTCSWSPSTVAPSSAVRLTTSSAEDVVSADSIAIRRSLAASAMPVTTDLLARRAVLSWRLWTTPLPFFWWCALSSSLLSWECMWCDDLFDDLICWHSLIP